MTEKITDFHKQRGVLHIMYNAKNVTKNPDKKEFWVREFMLEIKGNSSYSSFPMFSLSGEGKINMLDTYDEGDTVIVTFTLRGNKYKRKTDGEEVSFTSLECMRIDACQEETKPLKDEKNDMTKKEGVNDFSALDDADPFKIKEDEPSGLPF